MENYKNVPTHTIKMVDGEIDEISLVAAFKERILSIGDPPRNVLSDIAELEGFIGELGESALPMLESFMVFYEEVKKGVKIIEDKPMSERDGEHVFFKDGAGFTEVKKETSH